MASAGQRARAVDRERGGAPGSGGSILRVRVRVRVVLAFDNPALETFLTGLKCLARRENLGLLSRTINQECTDTPITPYASKTMD